MFDVINSGSNICLHYQYCGFVGGLQSDYISTVALLRV